MNEKTYEELIERRNALVAGVDQEDADLDAIEKEIREINEELERRKVAETDREAADKKREQLRKLVANGAGETRENYEAQKEKKSMPKMKEIRSTAEYMNAWVADVKNRDEMYTETRRILTENALEANVGEGDTLVPVPTYVEERVQAIWTENRLLNRIHKTYFKGNLVVPYEADSSGATLHEEGADAVDEETLTIGQISLLVTGSIKKWISFSRSVLALKGEAFVEYLMDEFRNKIEAALVAGVITAIVGAPTTNQPTAIGVPNHTVSVLTLDTVAQAMALIEADNANPSLVMNRGTYAAMRAAQLNANYAVDPFEGLEIDFTSELPSITAAHDDDVIMIVGDLYAYQENLPNGNAVDFIIDPYTRKKENLVEILGELFAAGAITQPGKIVRVVYHAE